MIAEKLKQAYQEKGKAIVTFTQLEPLKLRKKDGEDHINVTAKVTGTPLGRLLNDYHPVQIPIGSLRAKSLQHWLHFIGDHNGDIALLSAQNERVKSSDPRMVNLPNQEFHYALGFWLKLTNLNADQVKLLTDNQLPIDLYHLKKIKTGDAFMEVKQRLREASWKIPVINTCIEHLLGGTTPDFEKLVRDNRLLFPFTAEEILPQWRDLL